MAGLSLYGYAVNAQAPVPTLYTATQEASAGNDFASGTAAGPGAYIPPATPIKNDAEGYELGKSPVPADIIMGNVLPSVVSMYDLRIWVIASGILSLIAIIMSVVALSEVKRRI